MGLRNVSITFFVLYVLEKYVELHQELRWNGWVLILLISTAMYKAALWLHRNPVFVVNAML